jgi:polyhydroxyalkanoate synthesis regulator phasin
MTDKSQTVEVKPAAPESAAATPPAPRRGPGHRGADVRDTVAEMAAKAQEISQEAGSKVAAAMKDVINAAAGIAGFAVESARDLVQYMVRRGQMTQEEADKLLREAEEAHVRRGGHAPPPPPKRIEPEVRRPEAVSPRPVVSVAPPARPATASVAAVAAKPAKPVAKTVAKAPAKKAAASRASSRPVVKASAKAKSSSRAAAKKSPAKKK